MRILHKSWLFKFYRRRYVLNLFFFFLELQLLLQQLILLHPVLEAIYHVHLETLDALWVLNIAYIKEVRAIEQSLAVLHADVSHVFQVFPLTKAHYMIVSLVKRSKIAHVAKLVYSLHERALLRTMLAE